MPKGKATPLPTRVAVLAELTLASDRMTIDELANITGRTQAAVRAALLAMEHEGLVDRIREGKHDLWQGELPESPLATDIETFDGFPGGPGSNG